jgi:hydroxyethylthiazole kinase-like uncharacterized protein yjeF
MPRSRRAELRLITDALLRRWPVPGPAKEGSKEERGRVLIIAGAVEMPGAAILASTAALRAGAGKVRVATAEAAAVAVGAAVPELFVLGIAEGKRRASSLKAILDSATKADVVLIGPGVRDEDATRRLLPELLRIEKLRALIIDAAALPIAAKMLTRESSLAAKTIITPHAAEMASLCELSLAEVNGDPQRVAREAAERFASTVVLKGAQTFISAGAGPTYLNKRGNVGLATAGSGDVLAGVLAGLCARGVDPLRAAIWAVALHARAGENLAKRLGPIGYLAREIADEIPLIMRRL